MQLSETLKQEREYVKATLAGKCICDKCGCTLDDYAERCAAPLGDPCPGFLAVAAVMAEFRDKEKA
jgi:hypothetical protein